uniref:FliA/WhiG family RNA polymerase sigma factor n=1 Tax=Prauserella sediminis TaxID=577680 RepID=UPI001E59DF87
MTEPTPVPNDTGGVSAHTVASRAGETVTSTREPADAPTAEPPVGDAAPASYGAPGTDGVPGADAASGADATAGTDAAAGTDAPVAVDATGTDAAAAAAAVTDTPVAGVDRADGDAPASGPARPLPADANGSGGGRAEADAAIKALWHEFATEPSQRVRDRLVLHYAPLVKYVAGRVGTGLPTHVDVADLIQSGIFGLVDAIEKFDPDRGLRFETYAMQRIRGAILDDLRSQDWVPRVVRSRAREVERTLERLGARLGRTPTDAEVAAELGISLGELHDLYGQLRLTSVVALETLVAAGRDSESVVESLPDDEAVDPAAVLVDRDNRKQLADAIAQLNERDRIVVSLYYFESLTLAEIGKVLGVTESRVSQLHTRAVLRLRAKLQEQSGT